MGRRWRHCASWGARPEPDGSGAYSCSCWRSGGHCRCSTDLARYRAVGFALAGLPSGSADEGAARARLGTWPTWQLRWRAARRQLQQLLQPQLHRAGQQALAVPLHRLDHDGGVHPLDLASGHGGAAAGGSVTAWGFTGKGAGGVGGHQLDTWQRVAEPWLRLVGMKSPGPRHWSEPSFSANCQPCCGGWQG
jgi:hypothetical protein